MIYLGSRFCATVALLIAGFVFGPGCGKKSDAPPAASSGPSQTVARRPRPLIGVSVLTLNNPFFKEMGDAYQAEGAKKGFDVQVVSGDMKTSIQADQVKDFIARKAAAIVLTPCDSKSVGTAIAEANKAGIPVFTADVATTAADVKVVSHCATDNLEGGRIAGRAMIEALGGAGAKGDVAVIDQPEVESAQMREKGFLEEVARAPGIVVVKRLSGAGNKAAANDATQDILQANPDVVAIFAITDPMALGSLAAVQKAGRAGRIKIIGFDGQLEARKAVKDGLLYGTVMQYPKKIAATTIENVDKFMGGDEVPKVVLMPPAFYRQADAAADPELK